jgi:hypothetical protein
VSDFVTSWLRTVVPALWASLASWLIAHSLLPAGLDLGGVANVLLVPVVLAVWHGVWRRLEPVLPPWLARLSLGSARTPSYTPAAPKPPQ